MEELLRLQHIRKKGLEGYELNDYNLTIFQGEIVYVQGVLECGKHCLERILTGQRRIDEGKIFWMGNPVTDGGWLGSLIGTIGIYHPMVHRMSIMDNLELIRKVPFAFRKYNEKKAIQQAQKILNELQIDACPYTKVESLSFLEEQKLGMVKLIISGVRLIIVNCVQNIYGDREAEILGDFMQHKSKEGVSFLIISEKPNPFLRKADRVQIIHQGIDLMEWRKGEFEVSWLKQYIETLEKHVCKQKFDNKTKETGKILCLLDLEWERKRTGQTFFHAFYEKNRSVWEQYIGEEPPEAGTFYNGKSVIIPWESGDALFFNISLEDNLSICVPDRAALGKSGIINKRSRALLVHDFLEIIGRMEPVQNLWELTLTERKILSIYRWVLARPKVLLLENPFSGLDISDINILSDYIRKLKRNDMKIVIYTSHMEYSTDFYDIMLCCENSRMTKMPTKGQFFPVF